MIGGEPGPRYRGDPCYDAGHIVCKECGVCLDCGGAQAGCYGTCWRFTP